MNFFINNSCLSFVLFVNQSTFFSPSYLLFYVHVWSSICKTQIGVWITNATLTFEKLSIFKSNSFSFNILNHDIFTFKKKLGQGSVAFDNRWSQTWHWIKLFFFFLNTHIFPIWISYYYLASISIFNILNYHNIYVYICMYMCIYI